MQVAKCKVGDFVVNDALLSSCAHARNRYQMYLMERKAEQERTEKGQKRKALMKELTSATKAKEDLEKVSKKLVNTADKKTKEAEKQKDEIEAAHLLKRGTNCLILEKQKLNHCLSLNGPLRAYHLTSISHFKYRG